MTEPRQFVVYRDTRESNTAAWERWFPAHVTVESRKLDTGDYAAQGFVGGLICERKTPTDLLGCMTAGRARFERELQRSMALKHMAIVVEGSMTDLYTERRGLEWTSVIGTLAAWTSRYGVSIIMAENERCAAHFCWRYLSKQIDDALRIERFLKRATKDYEKIVKGTP